MEWNYVTETFFGINWRFVVVVVISLLCFMILDRFSLKQKRREKNNVYIQPYQIEIFQGFRYHECSSHVAIIATECMKCFSAVQAQW